MSGGFPSWGEVCNGQDVGSVLASTAATTISGTTVNTKGSWSQLISALVGDCDLLVVDIYSATAGRPYLLDIGVGASGSEVVLCANLPGTYTGVMYRWVLPLAIPSGTRIAARVQVANTNYTVTAKAMAFSGGFMTGGYAGCEGIGITSGGSTYNYSITPNATADTLGSYAQIIGSTARDYAGLIPLVGPTGNYQSMSNVAIGPSGSEVVIIPNIYQTGESGSPFFVPIFIPAGSRLAMNIQSGSASSAAAWANLVGVFA